MAILNQRTGLARYRRYLQSVQERPLLQASLFLVFSLVLIIVLVALALKPTVVTIAGLVGKISEQKTIEQKLDAKIASLNIAKQNEQAVQSQLVLLDQALPDTPQFANWSQIIDVLATNASVEVVNVSFSQIPFSTQETAAKVSNFPFTLTLRGDYTQLRSFITSLENTRRIVSIETITITPQLATTESVALQMVINGYLTLSLAPKL
jgi:Tfp pilus assembly protein PilO